MGANILIEQMVQNGACDGIDDELCNKAVAKIVTLGGDGVAFARAILDKDFNVFAENYRSAYERVANGERTEVSKWDKIAAEIE